MAYLQNTPLCLIFLWFYSSSCIAALPPCDLSGPDLAKLLDVGMKVDLVPGTNWSWGRNQNKDDVGTVVSPLGVNNPPGWIGVKFGINSVTTSSYPMGDGGSYVLQLHKTECTGSGTSLTTTIEPTPGLPKVRDECDSLPCKNGARCLSLLKGYLCQCTSGFSGIDCGIGTALPPCDLSGPDLAKLLDVGMKVDLVPGTNWSWGRNQNKDDVGTVVSPLGVNNPPGWIGVQFGINSVTTSSYPMGDGGSYVLRLHNTECTGSSLTTMEPTPGLTTVFG